MNKEIEKRFLTNADESGRFIVVSKRTGRKYFVESISGNKVVWSDMDPATKKVTGSYGKKYKGAIDSKETLITKENGFVKIHNLEPGVSPLHSIDLIDSKYPDILDN